jgi:hypothetical protein
MRAGSGAAGKIPACAKEIRRQSIKTLASQGLGVAGLSFTAPAI